MIERNLSNPCLAKLDDSSLGDHLVAAHALELPYSITVAQPATQWNPPTPTELPVIFLGCRSALRHSTNMKGEKHVLIHLDMIGVQVLVLLVDASWRATTPSVMASIVQSHVRGPSGISINKGAGRYQCSVGENNPGYCTTAAHASEESYHTCH